MNLCKIIMTVSKSSPYLGLILTKHLHIGVVGAAFEKGQSKKGTSLGPKVIRDSSVLKNLKDLGHQIEDFGDLTESNAQIDKVTHSKVKNWHEVASYNKSVSDKVFQICQSNRKVLTLGGDHSIGAGTVHGHLTAYPDSCVIWVDAHADINTVKSTPSGNMHGMPLSFVLKELQDEPSSPEWNWVKNRLSAKNLAFIGLRDVDPKERKIINELGICSLSMEEVDLMGIKEAVQFTLNMIDPLHRRPLHVSFDVDALDPVEAPSTGTTVRGGLRLREGMTLLETVNTTGRLSALDIVEVNPAIGNSEQVGQTVEAARRLVLAAFGNNRQGNS
ncbi:hypothetical protein QYM36_017302 [Artemia franciscana]|uniref:Arginase n=1 Tax=Artemia franciscana TaxID=6661 RepID=A0AA88H5C3_ARTSF|nr:hypothetical protein QYM36_017302 [Artemia franciscana]